MMTEQAVKTDEEKKAIRRAQAAEKKEAEKAALRAEIEAEIKAKLAKDVPAQPTPALDKGIERFYATSKEVDHDLFKLSVARMLKWMGYNKGEKDPDDLIPAEHCHFFHTIDSDGRPQQFCSSIGGHFHKMEVVDDGSGVPKVKCVSGPLQFKFENYRKNRANKRRKIAVPANDFDTHTHESEYVRSEKVALRKVNVDAVELVRIEAAQTQAIPGIAG